MAKKDLLRDRRYRPFIERYHADPLAFAVEVCGMVPSEDQTDLLQSMVDPAVKVSVVSGTGTGKTACFAVIALWSLLCHPYAYYDGKVEVGSNTYIGAPRIQQVADGVWKELGDRRMAIAQGPHAWINAYYTISKTRVRVNGYADQWFIGQVAMQAGQAVGIAGKHRYWQLIIVDEAAGVPDEHFDVIDGTQTQAGNRTLMASQGVRSAGRFYDSHHELSREAGGTWLPLRFSSERSPFVTDQWLKDRAFECGGRDTVEYKVRVRGLFASDTSNILLTREEVQTILAGRKIIGEDEPYGVVLLVDVAAGEYRDDSVLVMAKIIGSEDQGQDARRVEFFAFPVVSNTRDEVDLSGDIVEILRGASDILAYTDAGGIGHSVIKLVERSGFSVTRINWGEPCFRKEFRDRYYNQRACAQVRFRDAVRQGRVSVTAALPPVHRNKITKQGSNLPYHFVEHGGLKYKMASKEDMARDGIKSPDMIDVMSFAFLEKVVYIPREPAARLSPSPAAPVIGASLTTDPAADVMAHLAELVGA
ncbi:hypothetical protein [Ideonella livida]|uniref:Terminase n=1 Tax=Ideonella livida TaxID=2707176 RepID=A0A7C9TGK2_9BURK|nr:hypothetical protein [Ideonella livida]NDY89738.1 hypothetical protein [Ideonella livida]